MLLGCHISTKDNKIIVQLKVCREKSVIVPDGQFLIARKEIISGFYDLRVLSVCDVKFITSGKVSDPAF